MGLFNAWLLFNPSGRMSASTVDPNGGAGSDSILIDVQVNATPEVQQGAH